MINLLYILPADILHDVYDEWLDLKDISTLDCAFFVIGEERDRFLDALSNIRQTDVTDPHSATKYDFNSCLFIEWLGSRKIKLKYLHITLSNYQTLLNLQLNLEFVEHIHIDSFTSANIEGYYFARTVIRCIVNECKMLMRFEFFSNSDFVNVNNCDQLMIMDISLFLTNQITHLSLHPNENIYQQLPRRFGCLVRVDLRCIDTETFCVIVSNNPALTDITVNLMETECTTTLLTYFTTLNLSLRRFHVENNSYLDETAGKIVTILRRFTHVLTDFSLFGYFNLKINLANTSKQLIICGRYHNVEVCDVLRRVPDVTHVEIRNIDEMLVTMILTTVVACYAHCLTTVKILDTWTKDGGMCESPLYLGEKELFRLCKNLKTVEIMFCATPNRSPPAFYKKLSEKFTNIQWL